MVKIVKINTYKWSVEKLDCIPSIDNKINVVSSIYWKAEGTDGTYTATTYGIQRLTYNPKNSYTVYEKLTEEEIIGWVKGDMGEKVSDTEKELDSLINNLVNPPIVTPALPWLSNLKGK